MSIASEISRISGNVADAYTAANAKGATMPVSQNSDNLATTISTIPSGITPTGTKSITANGVYDVTDFASADVQVPTTAPAHYVEKTVDANGKLVNSTYIINLDGATAVGDFVLSGQYYSVNFPSNTSVDLSNLTTISGQYACQYMFANCRGITNVDLSSLSTISGNNACMYMFQSCREITSIDLTNLTTISGASACQDMFLGCTGLTSIDLSGLTNLNGAFACQYMFQNCNNLTSVNLSGLTELKGIIAFQSMFLYCTSLATVYIGGTTAIDFGTNTNQFTNMFQNCSQNIDVYAPAANQTQIEAFSGYPNFGGTGTVTWHWRS